MKRSTAKNQGSAETGVAPSRWQRWLVIGAAVTAVFVVAGLIGSVVRAHKEKQLTLPSAATGASSLALPVQGHAPVTLTVYEDLRDPASKTFQETYGPAIAKLISAGLVTVNYREVADVDAKQGGTGSLLAANALACASDAKKFSDYRAVLLKNQPANVSDDAFGSDSALIKLAKKVKDLDTDVFRACVNGGNYKVWVQASTKSFDAAGLGSVPVLQMQVGGAAAATASPSPSPAPQVPSVTLLSATKTITPDDLLTTVSDAALKITPSPTPTKAAATHKASTKARKPHGSVSPSPTATH